MHEIKLTNTLSGKKEVFTPRRDGEVTMYSCGPTVYDYAHIGNFRSFLMSDILFRVLEHVKYKVKKVQNITDVGHLTGDDLADGAGEDKIAKKALKEKKDPYEIAQYFEKAFIEDEAVLRIKAPNAGRPRATDFIVEQIALTQDLIQKEFAYEANGSVYFRTQKYKAYGELSKNKLKDLVAGARVEINTEKEDPLDFALWKKADKDHLMQWESPWGQGFPGWHIECSAMSKALLGENFDIHTGGEDNVFPHHECERAQNACGFGGEINYWAHAKHLLVNGEKMSKSKGNFYTIKDLLAKGYSGEVIRYVLIAAHYKTALNFTLESLEMAQNSIARIVEAKRIFTEIAQGETPKTTETFTHLIKNYQSAITDDLNTPQALSSVFEIINKGLKLRETRELQAEQAAEIIQFLEKDFDPIFDIFPPETAVSKDLETEIEALIQERTEAKKNKDWARADEIRVQLDARGIELIDGKEKTTWRTK